MVVASGQAGLHEERAELVGVKPDPGRLLGDLGTAHVHHLDAVDLAWTLSGRVRPPPDTPGAELLDTRVLFWTQFG